jgi:hypothetical protein
MVMALLTLNNEELELLCLLKRRLFTPFEVVVNQFYEGSLDKALVALNLLADRKMVEFMLDRVIITAVGKKEIKKEEVKRGTTILIILE